MSGKSWSLSKAIGQGLSKLHSACPEEKCEDFSLKKGWFFIPFCTLSKNIVDFCQTITAGFPKLQFTCAEEKIERKKMKKRWFLGNFVLRVKKLDFGLNSLARFVIAAFGVSRGTCWAFFIGKTMIFEWFSDVERKSSGLC